MDRDRNNKHSPESVKNQQTGNRAKPQVQTKTSPKAFEEDD